MLKQSKIKLNSLFHFISLQVRKEREKEKEKGKKILYLCICKVDSYLKEDTGCKTKAHLCGDEKRKGEKKKKDKEEKDKMGKEKREKIYPSKRGSKGVGIVHR